MLDRDSALNGGSCIGERLLAVTFGRVEFVPCHDATEVVVAQNRDTVLNRDSALIGELCSKEGLLAVTLGRVEFVPCHDATEFIAQNRGTVPNRDSAQWGDDTVKKDFLLEPNPMFY